jgi:glycine cleavage system aminomethyltransferase T
MLSRLSSISARTAKGTSLRAFATFPNHSNVVNPPADVSNSPVKNTDIDAMYKNSRLKQRKVPIQLRQSGDAGDGGLNGEGSRLLIDTRVRKGPYWHLSQEAGAWCYQVYNKIYHPRAYIPVEEGGLMEEYRYLTEHVTMWNVAVERQIQVIGPDATKFVDYVITRRAELCGVEKCKYVILCNSAGGVLNDPILLRPAENEWWFSLADSDIGMYLQGVNHDGRWDCEINEIDVAPVQIQGPKAPALMADVFGDVSKCSGDITKMKYYDMIHAAKDDWKCVISASGFSTELGYEIYLHNATEDAEKMWKTMLEAGKKHNLKVIAPGHHRRIEAGLLSYGQDLDIEVNPYECGMGWQVDLTKDAFIGKDNLAKIKKEGVTHKIAGLRMGGDPITWYAADFYHVFSNGELVGYVSSAWYSPTQESNIALAMLPADLTKLGTKLEVALPKMYSNTPTVPASVEKTPFRAPAKGNEGTGLKTTGSKFD